MTCLIEETFLPVQTWRNFCTLHGIKLVIFFYVKILLWSAIELLYIGHGFEYLCSIINEARVL